jgi:hypothetical protein
MINAVKDRAVAVAAPFKPYLGISTILRTKLRMMVKMDKNICVIDSPLAVSVTLFIPRSNEGRYPITIILKQGAPEIYSFPKMFVMINSGKNKSTMQTGIEIEKIHLLNISYNNDISVNDFLA